MLNDWILGLALLENVNLFSKMFEAIGIPAIIDTISLASVLTNI